MVSLNRTAGGHDAVRQEVGRQLQDVVKVSQNLGEVQKGIRERVDALGDPEHPANNSPEMQRIRGMKAGEREKMKEVMEKKQKELEPVLTEYKHVNVADDLSENTGGETHLKKPEKAKVNENIVLDADKLEQVATHESHKKVGHASQEIPVAPHPDIVLIVQTKDGPQEMCVETTLEGDIEQGVSGHLEGNRKKHRADQPEKVYGKGQRGANAAIDAVGQGVWDKGLKETGYYGTIQKELWKAQLTKSPDKVTFTRVIQEAEKTGYYNEAREVLQPYMAQMMARARQETMPAAMSA